MNATVLTRLLKGQAPSVMSSGRTSAAGMLNLQDITGIKKTDLESKIDLSQTMPISGTKNYLPAKMGTNSTLLFYLNTLYSTQARVWRKYDE